LTLALVLAIADTGALLWFGFGTAVFDGHPAILLVVPLMIAGVVGLLRLRTWGLIAGIVSNLLVAILAATRVLDLPGPLRTLFIATATLQLLVPLPMLVTIARRRPPSDPERWRRLKAWGAPAAIVGIAAVSVFAVFVLGDRLPPR